MPCETVSYTNMDMNKNQAILKSCDDLLDGILRLTVCMTDSGCTESHGSLTHRTTSSGTLPLAKLHRSYVSPTLTAPRAIQYDTFPGSKHKAGLISVMPHRLQVLEQTNIHMWRCALKTTSQTSSWTNRNAECSIVTQTRLYTPTLLDAAGWVSTPRAAWGDSI